jgi:hypothetical protein
MGNFSFDTWREAYDFARQPLVLTNHLAELKSWLFA